MSIRATHKEFESKLKGIHPSYKLLEEYKGQRHIECICVKHKQKFLLDKVNNVYSSKNKKCSECKSIDSSNRQRMSQSQFESRILALFPDHEIKGKYINVDTPVAAFCKIHKLKFDICPNNALYNKYSQCPGCRKGPAKSSKISQKWIKWVCRSKGWKFANILCSENGNEHYIKDVGLVDGYHKPTNTVLEFHGDYWHGNPVRFKPNKVLFSGLTAKQLYNRTKKKEAKIMSLGFNLIVMWEHDYRAYLR